MEIDNEVALSDEEDISVQKVLQTLEESWLNEKFSPEILPHQTELVECMLEQIQGMEDNIQKLKPDDFRVVIHRMELDRIRYMITSYLRTRLEKIEEFTVHILEEESKRDAESFYLSTAELKFAREYVGHMENHFKELALNSMPLNVRDFDKSTMKVCPNISSHVFLRSRRDVTGVVIEGDTETGDEEIDLEKNSQHIMQYRAVADLVKSAGVQLI